MVDEVFGLVDMEYNVSIRYPYFGMQEGDCESTDGVEDQDHAFVGRRKVVELGSRLARAGQKWI